MPSNPEEDQILYKLLAAHDPAALEGLYQYARLLEIVLERRFGPLLDDEDRKDIVGDVLVHAYATGDRFDPRLSSLKSWLIMLAVFQAREFLRRNGGGANIRPEKAPPGSLRFEHRFVVDEQRPSMAMQRLLDQLPPRQGHVITMHYYEGRPSTEIATMLHISPSAVRAHLCNGRKRLYRLAEDGLAA